ncbi:hypothetical protein AAFF_G00152240, partial [Aldrovandia affinis]
MDQACLNHLVTGMSGQPHMTRGMDKITSQANTFRQLHRWLLPFVGHMGICTSAGVIRDFAGPYFVS